MDERYTHLVWSPYTKRNIEKVEKVQRRATKFILMSLENRRFLADTTFFYKALNGLSNIKIDTYVDFYSNADRYSFRNYDELSLRRNMLERIHLNT